MNIFRLAKILEEHEKHKIENRFNNLSYRKHRLGKELEDGLRKNILLEEQYKYGHCNSYGLGVPFVGHQENKFCADENFCRNEKTSKILNFGEFENTKREKFISSKYVDGWCPRVQTSKSRKLYKRKNLEEFQRKNLWQQKVKFDDQIVNKFERRKQNKKLMAKNVELGHLMEEDYARRPYRGSSGLACRLNTPLDLLSSQIDLTGSIHKSFKFIADQIIFMVLNDFLDIHFFDSEYFSAFKNILPFYLASGYILLSRYLKRRLTDYCLLFKMFFTCCWISAKASQDQHVSCFDLMPYLQIGYGEINYLEAHILAKINYNIEISREEIRRII